MTEAEAKALACELERHKDWQVIGIIPILPTFWSVWLAHRRKAAWVGISDPHPESVKKQLTLGRSDVTYTIDLK